jgi:hypothetical protein
MRQFSVASISPLRSTTKEPVGDLARELDTLSISSRQQLWTVSWDSTVVITGKEVEDQVHIAHKVLTVLFKTSNS